VKDHSIVSTGYNGPSREVPHCGHERIVKDITLEPWFFEYYKAGNSRAILNTICPRKALGFESGTHMELCPAVHAEANAIIDAARKGASTVGTTLYMNCIIPCKSCYGLLINAGIVEIVVDDTKVYDKHTQYLIDNSNIKIRRFEL
jgi:dCMP deaminase